MRIGHASISENKDNGRNGKAQAGDQTGKEVCIRSFYVKPWKYLLRCKDTLKAETMAQACESICQNAHVGYDQSQRLTLHNELVKIGYDYSKLSVDCECDCSSLMTVCAEIAGINIPYTNGNAPVTANMVKIFQKTGYFDVITEGINEECNLLRGDILVGAPNTHTVMVLDDGMPTHIQKRRVIKLKTPMMVGSDIVLMQHILHEMGYKISVDGKYGKESKSVIEKFQSEHGLVVDGICGPKTWCMLEKYN